jgi:hypothetical protein
MPASFEEALYRLEGDIASALILGGQAGIPVLCAADLDFRLDGCVGLIAKPIPNSYLCTSFQRSPYTQ